MKVGDWLIGAAVVVAACFLIFVIVLIPNYIEAHDDTFTESEQYDAVNALCASHDGILNFDDADDSGSGMGPANVICGDGFLSEVHDPHPDPDPGDRNPYSASEPWWSPLW